MKKVEIDWNKKDGGIWLVRDSQDPQKRFQYLKIFALRGCYQMEDDPLYKAIRSMKGFRQLVQKSWKSEVVLLPDNFEELIKDIPGVHNDKRDYWV